MEVTVLLMFGLVLVLIQIILVRRITFRPIPWFTRMAASARLESPYAYGGFLFIVNMIIFLVMTALVVLTIMMNVAFSLFLFAGAGVFISFMIWIQMSISREGTKKEKRIIGGIGSAFTGCSPSIFSCKSSCCRLPLRNKILSCSLSGS